MQDAYAEKYGEMEWDETGCLMTAGELSGAIEICLREGKRMKEVRLEWCEELPPWIWT